jgi:radical SAM superfamily enzyme YgiQ (UPF0313 family)
MRILLLQLYGFLQPLDAEPLSTECLAGALDTSDIINIQIIHNKKNSIENFKGLLSHYRYDIIGISAPESTLLLSFELLDIISARFLGEIQPIIILGHSLPTNLFDAYLERYPAIIIVRGWGESALVEIVHKIENGVLHLGDIPNVVYKLNGITHFGEFIEETPINIPKRVVGNFFHRIEGSRGCAHGKCTF